MSSSSRIEELALGCLIALSIALLGYGALSSDNAEKQQSWHYYQRCAQQIEAAAIAIEAATDEQVSTDTQQNSSNQEPNWCDLAAQQSMAESTRAATWASIAGACFTAIGIGLLWLTLHETRRTLEQSAAATRAANENNWLIRSEQRPWVTSRMTHEGRLTLMSYDRPDDTLFRFEGSASLQWHFEPENVGKSPAFALKAYNRLSTAESYFDARQQLKLLCESDLVASSEDVESALFPNERINHGGFRNMTKLQEMPNANNILILLHVLSYRSQDSQILGLEGRVVAIHYDERTLGPWPCRLTEISDYRVTK